MTEADLIAGFKRMEGDGTHLPSPLPMAHHADRPWHGPTPYDLTLEDLALWLQPEHDLLHVEGDWATEITVAP